MREMTGPDVEAMLKDRALAAARNGMMIVAMRETGGKVDAEFVYVNPAFERITGYAACEVIGRHPRLLQRHDSRQGALALLRAAIAARERCQVRLRNYRKDGTLFWNELSIEPVLSEAGELSHYIGVQTDVSDYVLSQQTLRLRTDRLNAVFDLSPDGFVVLDEDEFVSMVNPAFERLTGMSAVSLVGRHRQSLEAQLRRRCLPEVAGEEIRKPAFLDTQPAEGDPRAPDDSAVTDIWRLAMPEPRTLLRRTRRSHERLGDTVMSFRDITREAEIDRMKSEFLSTAAHELRTPMTSIYGFTELLLRREFESRQRREILSTVHRQAGLLVNLVNELLDLARIESRRGTTFNKRVQLLQPIIDAAVVSLMVAGDEREVTVARRPEAIHVDVDREKLTLALTNVLSNAYKYSPGGGEIRIELLDRRRNDGREVGVQVSDEGIGMSPEEQQRIFERFYRADASGAIPGTGLGMSIAKEIIELQGGQVAIWSAPGVGTRVTFWLPVVRRLVQEA